LSEDLRHVWDEDYEFVKYRGRYYPIIEKMHYDGGSYTLGEELEPTPQLKGAVEVLWEIFGGTTTETGHKLLDSHVGLIYGDSITYNRAYEITGVLRDKGFASTNVVFGIGSYTYQYVTRDTWGWAVKATYGQVNGIGRSICKNPKTDSGVKKSARGLLKVVKGDQGLKLLQDQTWPDILYTSDDELKVVFHEGTLRKEHSLADIRARVAAQ
jgi:nicotinamide phosphoribosyltransferase